MTSEQARKLSQYKWLRATTCTEDITGEVKQGLAELADIKDRIHAAVKQCAEICGKHGKCDNKGSKCAMCAAPVLNCIENGFPQSESKAKGGLA